MPLVISEQWPTKVSRTLTCIIHIIQELLLKIAFKSCPFDSNNFYPMQLFGKPVRVNKASAHQKNLDVGANIFIGNLDPEVDEKLLYDTFSAFGVILQTPKVSKLLKCSIHHLFS